MTRIGRALAVAIATTALAACSSSSTPVPTATSGGGSGTGGGGGGGLGFTADALCALVTSDDVGAAIGTSVPAGVPSGVNAPSCTWTASNAAGATIAATDPGSVGQIPVGLQGISGAHVAQVPNLGDAAYFAAGASGPNVELDISKGGRAITITVGIPNTFDQGTIEAAELAIGTAAAKNM